MTTEAIPDAFCTAVETADIVTVQGFLSQNPSLASAILPDGWPVFLLQSVAPDAAMIDLLIAQGADPNVRNLNGETLLHLTGDPVAIRKLLTVGADRNALDHQGLSPMMAHAPYPETGPDAIFTLLAEGADPGLQTPNGETLLSRLPEGPRYAPLRKALQLALREQG